MEGISMNDYLPKGQTVNGAYYAELIGRLRQAIKEKRRDKPTRGVNLLHDNAPVHISKTVRDTLHHARFHFLNHPPYSPDLAPTDNYMFSNLKGRSFGSDEKAGMRIQLIFFRFRPILPRCG